MACDVPVQVAAGVALYLHAHHLSLGISFVIVHLLIRSNLLNPDCKGAVLNPSDRVMIAYVCGFS